MSLQNYEMNDILLVVAGCTAALTTLLLASQKSKCSKVQLCCGLMDCDRDVKAVVQTELLEKRGIIGPTETTPKFKSSPVTPLTLELTEPEAETSP